MGQRAQALADRIEQGADALAKFAETLSSAEWKVAVPKDGRTVGVIVHHVGNMYPIEIELAQTLAGGKPIETIGSIRRVSQLTERPFSDPAPRAQQNSVIELTPSLWPVP